jgi:hypothetical protein
MQMKPQSMNMDAEKFRVTNHGEGGCPQQPAGRIGGSLQSVSRQSEKTMTDSDYMRLLEEHYGIREEGLF